MRFKDIYTTEETEEPYEQPFETIESLCKFDKESQTDVIVNKLRKCIISDMDVLDKLLHGLEYRNLQNFSQSIYFDFSIFKCYLYLSNC